MVDLDTLGKMLAAGVYESKPAPRSRSLVQKLQIAQGKINSMAPKTIEISEIYKSRKNCFCFIY